AGAGAGAALLALPRPPLECSPAPGATVVHPGAASGARRWPADRFAAVAAAEVAAGRAVVVTGAAAEQALAEEVAARAGLDRSCVLAGATDIGSLAALVAHAGRVICGDTGVAHLASAFGAPSVVLFGPVSPAVGGPPADGPHRVLWTGRLGDPHAASPSEGLLEISVDQVLAELAALPPPGPGAGRPSPSKLRSRTAPASRSTS
ncbi:MAG: glycosyltransferase family 9 protein, partial [Acidimicrobiales bacterium]